MARSSWCRHMVNCRFTVRWLPCLRLRAADPRITFQQPIVISSQLNPYPKRLLLMVARQSSTRGYHCSSMVYAKEGGKKMSKESKTKQEHGSVLMQFTERKEDPKAVTVGAKDVLERRARHTDNISISWKTKVLEMKKAFTSVVQAGKDMSYLFVILAGFAVTGFLLWSIGSEFFLSDSPSTIFTKALKRVKEDPRVMEALGEPITGHGEMSGRGRRRHIAHQEYIVDGVSYMRVKFYVDGSKRKGTAYLDLKKNDSGKYECRFLFVELTGYPHGTIVLEDNR